MRIIKNVVVRFFNERFFDQAAQTAYYLLLSMFPFFLFILSLLSLFPVNEEMLITFLRPFTPDEAFTVIEENVQAVLKKGQGKVLYASLVTAFWVTSMAVQSLARSLDLANGYIRRYAFWKVLIRDLGVTLLFMLVIPLSLFLPIIEKALYRVVTYYDTIEDWQGWFYIWPNVKWGLGTLFLFLFFLLFYKVVPTGKMKLKEALPGAVFSAFGWQLFSLVFGSYVSNVDYTRLYGQLSGIILLVIWFYLTAVIILISGLLNAEWRKLSGRKRRRIIR
ncbi:YihY/virulence factor BrkB family protein [Sporosarcina sp. ANT_H38]|uniref:YihY/virulence factor BrkB family protein n=1 Tax=Sporosarcina sp. ANT_H38 TaxID=2597358 RepID=UPI0011F12D23|nr:YihY/virulence factor BrkB family protein [Sporosarcina sp. ANT_H38]KAA0955955.1 YihY/virulence factor BrkB family protein [Sporosarcina sp. ANT_H38]